MDDKAKVGLMREIDRYLDAGRELFPLRPRQKKPLHSEWNKRKYSRRALHQYVHEHGCNIGWRLGPRDVVIDVDPRHPGAARAEGRMTEKWGVASLKDICPVVHTGGEDHGRHYYVKTTGTVKLKTATQEFQGIDFRRLGHYVLIAGCIHPDTGRDYQWDLFCPQTVPTMPPWLFEMLRVPSSPATKANGSEPMSLAEIEGHLRRIPVVNHRGYDDWLRIGMAIHHASEGLADGEELWVNWCTSDPYYCDADEIARAKWASFSTRRDEGVTAATLVAAAMAEGGSPSGLPADIVFDVPVQAAPSLLSVDDFTRLLNREDRPTLAKAVSQAKGYGIEHWDDLRSAIKCAYHSRLGIIDKLSSQYEKDKKEQKRKAKMKAKRASKEPIRLVDDPAINVADHVLETHSKGTNAQIIHAKNQQFYEYKGTHWEPIPQNEITQMCFNSAEAIQMDPKNQLKFRSSALFAATEKVLIAKTTKREDVFQFQEPPRPVVNTRNCEVWINPDGTHEARPHNPESYLLSCLKTDYDPAAECPRFNKALAQLFEHNSDPGEMIRHLYEFYGYVMQPTKDIPTWWMFQGDGSNGKSFCLSIYRELLGTAVSPRPMGELSDNGKNNHALASLVGKLLVLDDDAKVDANLPESALKKLAERKLFEANPKGKDAFTFLCCATPVMLINGWPRIRDLSWGLLRKAYILPFRRLMDPEEYDLTLEPYIKTHELPGVLNGALAGYHRLRKRGRFLEPLECKQAKNEWLRAANALVEFTSTEINKTGNGSWTPLHDVYQRYLQWCYNVGGVKHPAAKHRFEITLRQLGFTLGKHDETPALLSAALTGSAEDVFS